MAPPLTFAQEPMPSLDIYHPKIAHSLPWNIFPTPYGSYYFPIAINHTKLIKYKTTNINRKWKFNEAKLEIYQAYMNEPLASINKDTDINQITEIYTKPIIESAELAIGYKSIKLNSKLTPWWNENCKNAAKQQKQALSKYRKNLTTNNLIKLKEIKAFVRTTIKEAKETS